MRRARGRRAALAACLLVVAACGSSHDKHAQEDARVEAVADAIHAGDGTEVFRRARSIGVFDQGRSLTIVTKRPGSRARVVQRLLDAIAGAGYRPSASRDCLDRDAAQCVFTEPVGRPHVSLASAADGSVLSYEDGSTTRVLVVPAGTTGIRIVISDENPPGS
jgi:hypothetical protein